jgi:hypothetical protein
MKANDISMDVLDALALKVASKIKPSIPVEIDLWDIETCANYLKREPKSFRNKYRTYAGFPKAIRINGGRPLFPAKEVVEWAMNQRGK